MKITLCNTLKKRPISEDHFEIPKIILNNPILKSYLKDLKLNPEIVEIYDKLEKGVKINGLSVERVIDLTQKYSDTLILFKKIESRINFINAFKQDPLILICSLVDKTDEVFKDIFEFIEFPSLKSKYEVFLLTSSKNNREIIMKKEGNSWEIICRKYRYLTNWVNGISVLIKQGFTINLIYFNESVKENTSSIESIHSIKEKVLEKKRNPHRLEIGSACEMHTIKVEGIIPGPKFWLCKTCSLPNYSTNVCELCLSPNS